MLQSTTQDEVMTGKINNKITEFRFNISRLDFELKMDAELMLFILYYTFIWAPICFRSTTTEPKLVNGSQK
jgi:hypothetical protein